MEQFDHDFAAKKEFVTKKDKIRVHSEIVAKNLTFARTLTSTQKNDAGPGKRDKTLKRPQPRARADNREIGATSKEFWSFSRHSPPRSIHFPVVTLSTA